MAAYLDSAARVNSHPCLTSLGRGEGSESYETP